MPTVPLDETLRSLLFLIQKIYILKIAVEESYGETTEKREIADIA